MTNRYSTPHLDEYIASVKNPKRIEQRILSRIWDTFSKAGNPIRAVYDGEETNPIANKEEFWYQVLNLDEFYLYTATEQWVRFVNGNEWDAVVDYVMSLEETMEPINEFVEDNAF